MKRWLPLVLICVLVVGAYQWKFGSWRWSDPGTLQGDTCAGKERCVSVYMAPWCPHCKSAVPQVQKMIQKAQKSGKNGVRVVIGMGHQPGDNQKMASSIAQEGVVIDHDNKIARELNVRGVPSFTVLDSEGAVVLEGSEAYQWIGENF